MLLGPAGALAQWRCDCTTIVATCSAQVTPRASWIDVTTDARQCARVDYFVDGLPFVTTVVEGQSRIDWMSPRPDPDVRVQSCQVCVDNAAGAQAERSAGGAGEASVDPLEPLIRWAADYPTQAQMQGIAGHATVEFDVNAQGIVENASVVGAEPGEVFDAAALDAVRRWRYRADPERSALRLSERIEFSLGDMIWNMRATAAPAQADDPTRVPRNDCIREDTVFNFGEMIEAELINACADPLVVYGCAQGVGRQVSRWVCTDSAQLRSVLVRPGDERIGTTLQHGEQAGRVEWLDYTDSFYVARAPNSQYWWIACAPTDEACRQDARMWVRSMDRQPASVDPRGRASIAVAGSY
jgi:TonB family protein